MRRSVLSRFSALTGGAVIERMPSCSTPSKYHGAVVQFVVLFICTVLIMMGVSCLSPVSSAKAFELRDGVVIDPDRQEMYLMNPGGGIDAVTFADGSILWSTKEAAKPLALVGNRLVTLANPAGTSNELKFVIFNTQAQETPILTQSIHLPSDVRVSIDDTLNSKFHTRATVKDETVFVAWKYSYKKIRGAVTSADSSNQAQTNRGGIRLDPSSGDISSIEIEKLPATLAKPPLVNLVGADRLGNLPEPQFVSATGDHVFTSKRIADDREWNKYLWTIYERTTGNEIGKIKSHRPQVPFFISDSRIIYETRPYFRRTDEGLIDEPFKIRGVDLGSNRELWSQPVRDTAYRGPYPP